jgi:hypothetical protein
MNSRQDAGRAPPHRQAVGVAARLLARGLGWKIAAGAAAALFCLLCFAGLFVASSPSPASGECSLAAGSGGGIPANYVPWLEKAATKYKLGPKGFSIVAAIHYVESDFGRSPLPGVARGTQNSAGAEGPGQFLVPSWETYGQDANGDGVKDVYGIPDSIFGTANYMHLSGAPKDWHSAIFAYNHAEWYVEEVLEKAAGFGGRLVCTEAPPPQGDALIHAVQKLFRPRAFKAIPVSLWVGAGSPESVDSRIWPDAVWLLQTFHLRVTAAREAGHNTHGDGTAMDMVPASGEGWDGTARRAAETLGWREDCGASGSAPVCPLLPAIQFIGYNGYPGHGDPAHAGSNAHLHVSWKSSDYGCPGLCPPREWVETFPLSG